MIAYQKVHGREESSKALAKTHAEWAAKKDHHTVAKDQGHLAQATEATKHAHDKHTADNTSEAEMIAYQKVHGRQEASKALTKAHEAYDQRDHSGTKTDKLGHFAIATKASAHHHDKHTADNTPEAEHIAYLQAHERQEVSKRLAEEHAAFDARKASMVGGNHTAADANLARGRLLQETEASKSMHKKAFKSASEVEADAMKHERGAMAAANDAAKSAWKRRMDAKKHAFTTPAGASAHFAAETEASAHRHDAAAVAEAHAARVAAHGRLGLEEAGTQAAAEYAQRMAKKNGTAATAPPSPAKGSRPRLAAAAPAGKHAADDEMEAAAREQSAKAGAVLSSGRAAVAKARAAAAAREAVRAAKDAAAKQGAADARKHRDASRKKSWLAAAAAPVAKAPQDQATARLPSGASTTPSFSGAKKPGPLAFVPDKFAFWRKDKAAKDERKASKLKAQVGVAKAKSGADELAAAKAKLAALQALRAERSSSGARTRAKTPPRSEASSLAGSFNEKVGTAI
jgi:hypothetical protein